MRGYIHARRGEPDSARAALAALGTRPNPGPVAFERAIVHYGLGEFDRAMDLLEDAIEARDWRVRLLKQEPMFERLRPHPGYAELLRKVGL